jgi:hypothetical protein
VRRHKDEEKYIMLACQVKKIMQEKSKKKKEETLSLLLQKILHISSSATDVFKAASFSFFCGHASQRGHGETR